MPLRPPKLRQGTRSRISCPIESVIIGLTRVQASQFPETNVRSPRSGAAVAGSTSRAYLVGGTAGSGKAASALDVLPPADYKVEILHVGRGLDVSVTTPFKIED